MIKAVVVGAGRIALSHLPHILTHPKLDLVAIVEPNIIARFIMKRLTRAKVVSSLKKLDFSDYEAAFILTPPQTHFLITKSLLEQGKHVFLEKPLSLNPSHSLELFKLAKKNKVEFAVGYVYRFHPVFMKVKELLNSPVCEEIVSADINMRGNVVSEETPKTWRNVGLGSGCIFDYGCHAIDLSLFLFGRADEVICLEKHELFQRGVVDKFSAKLEFRANSNFDLGIYCNWADSSVRKAGITIKIDTANDSLWTDGQLLKIRGKNNADFSIKDLNTDVPYYLRGEEFQNQLDHFVHSISSNRLSYQDAEDAVICDQIISQLYEKNL
jgi:scyllo-inositol 2-dehydrogenase (NADP+)